MRFPKNTYGGPIRLALLEAAGAAGLQFSPMALVQKWMVDAE